jgi:phytoene desaturase
MLNESKDGRPHAAIIGSGFGGLAAAVRLGVRGYRVTILERLDQPGGRARVFQQDGFTFDAGPTVITAPFLFEELWELCGRRLGDDVDLRSVHPFYRIRFDDGDVFDYSGDAELMREEIRRFSPEDEEGYARFLAMSERIFDTGFTRLGHVPFDSVWDMARIVPDMIQLQSHLTVYRLVAKFIKHPKLRQVLSFHPLLVGGNPFATTSIYTLIAYLERQWGVHFPIGGTGALVQGLLDLLTRLGGELRLNADVSEIVVEDGRARGVRLADGETVAADIVVSNADSAWTYRHLVPESARRTWTDRKLERSRYSMGLFVWYFGTKRQYPDVAHHSILLGPRYKGLLDDIFGARLPPDFSLYLHRPTATDPGLAPEGMDGFYVLSPVPNLEGDVDWGEQAEPYRQAIEKQLADTVLPGLGEEIATSRVMTPLDFREELLSFRGAAFSFEPILSQSAWFRPHNRSEEVEGLYLVGAGTHPGAGVPGVLSSARVLDTVVPDPEALRS